MRRIVFTGGGTGGHIIPNVAILQKLKNEAPDVEILYIGSKKGPEATMIPSLGFKYKSVPTGKLRRYFSFWNFVDFFKVPFGVLSAYFILRKFKPAVVFSKGGYVSLPVIYAAHWLKIPIVLHESDASPGLANRLSAKKASLLCLAYEESEKHFPRNVKKVVTGNPVRENILKGDPESGYSILGFNEVVPTILIMGGSQGAKHVNDAVFESIFELVKHYQVIHICGKGKLPKGISLPQQHRDRYKTFEYVDKELPDYYAISDLIISRSGANSIAEIEALGIPTILVPIGSAASRGEQMLNAIAYKKIRTSTEIIPNDDFDKKKLLESIEKLLSYEGFVKGKFHVEKESVATKKVVEVLKEYISN
jgi:UDP-N-acetylglucosamine--N-acetylmuramyl-(pentapeptide) pyrophosphoryl-undecaprenol N-acetylglucosamine transferase